MESERTQPMLLMSARIGALLSVLAVAVVLQVPADATADEAPRRFVVDLPTAGAGPGQATADLEDVLGDQAVQPPATRLPFAVVTATPTQLAHLRTQGLIVGATPDGVLRPQLDGAMALNGSAAAAAAGAGGEGRTLVVVDTGLQADHPAVAGRVVGEACFVTRYATASSPGTPGCPNGATAHIGQGAAQTCASPACRHGTYVAVAAAGRGGPGSQGVAPQAGVYPIQVFDFASPGCSAGCASYGDVLRALDHVTSVIGTLDVAAVNLSVTLDGLRATSTCDHRVPSLAAAVAWLGGHDIPVVASSGNLDLSRMPTDTPGIAAPACVRGVVSVGAVRAARAVAGWSQYSRDLDFLALGAGLDVDTASGGVVTGRVRVDGTSFAAPQVSGALALAEELLPGAALDSRLRWLRLSGVPVVDTRPRGPDLVTPRLRMRAPIQLGDLGALVPGGGIVDRDPLVGDFDGDGLDDLLAPRATLGPRIAFGTAQETFELVASPPMPSATGVLVGSFIGPPEGADDVFWTTSAGRPEVLWRGDRTRHLIVQAQPRSYARSGVAGDFDGDGHDDILWFASSEVAGAIWAGGPTAFTKERRLLAAGPHLVGDLDADGDDDLLIFRAANVVELRFGSPDLSFEGVVTSLPALPSTLADVDGDGDLDAVFGGALPAIHLFDDEDFLPPTSLGRELTGATLVPADVDGDGRDELVSGGAVGTVSNLLQGLEGRASVLTGGVPVPFAADFDGDGRDEVLWSRPGGATEIWWPW